jgi:hypothetical protein
MVFVARWKVCAKTLLEMQVDEIRKLRDWLCQWYGNCNFRSDGDLHPKP